MKKASLFLITLILAMAFTACGEITHETKNPELKPTETKATETMAPDADVPETDAPKTDAPETKAPETKAPETKAPETKAPETKTPETKTPETKAPETKAPETKAPETKAPETKAPETKVPETEAPGLVDGMRADFKAAMDAYESFYISYCETLEKYAKNPLDMQIMAEYFEVIGKAEEMNKAFEKWNNEDLNNAELNYYMAVNSRVLEMLANIDVA